jgi:hypothetical protein
MRLVGFYYKNPCFLIISTRLIVKLHAPAGLRPSTQFWIFTEHETKSFVSLRGLRPQFSSRTHLPGTEI